MKSKWYSRYGYYDVENEFSDSKFLLTNITGFMEMDSTFITDRTRTDYYIMYVLEGTFTANFDMKEYELSAGDLLLIQANNRQYYYKKHNKTLKYFWSHFTGYGANDVLSNCGFAKSGVYKIGLSDKIFQAFKSYFSDFYGKPQADTYIEISSAAHLMEIFCAMRDSMDRTLLKSNDAEQKIYNSLEFIQANYTLPITIDSLAKSQGLCVGYYSKMFNKYMGMSPQNFIINLRIQNACMLISQSDMNISQISLAVGYDDPLYFSRIFKKHIGVSPSCYKLEISKN